MSQKVQIASILLSDPEVCVLDEPTTGLDPVNVQIVEDLLHERRRNGRTTILSTHHMNQVESLCDRVALINQGQLMVYGGVDEVRRRYSLPEVRVHARGPIPAIAAVARVTDEGDGHYRLLLSDGTPPHEVLAALVGPGRRGGTVRAAARADGRHLRSRGPGGTGMSGWQKIKTVATFEFLSTVKRPGYLIATFGMPLFMAAYGGVVAIPAYFAEKSSRQPAVLRRGGSGGRAAPRGRSRGRRWFAQFPRTMRRALEAAGQAEALDKAVLSENFVFRPVATEEEARRALAARQLKGFFVIPKDYMKEGRLDVYSPESVTMSGSDSRNALSDLLRKRLIEQRMDATTAARVLRPIARTAALRGDPDRRDPRRRRRGVDPPAGGADHLHGAVPDLGADDVGLPDAGHRDREGEQGRRRAAGVGQSRSDPRRQAAGAGRARGCCRLRCGSRS